MEEKGVVVHPVTFSTLEKRKVTSKDKEIGLWEDILIRITAELGRTKRPLKDVLNIKEGTILELEKSAYEPFEVLANGKRIARGQIVVNNDKLGIRITELVNE